MDKNIRVREALECICRVFDISIEELLSPSKKWDIVKGRHVAYKVMFMLVGNKLNAAKILRKDRNSLRSGIESFDSLYKYDKKFRFKANRAMQEIIKIKYEETSDDQTKIR